MSQRQIDPMQDTIRQQRLLEEKIRRGNGSRRRPADDLSPSESDEDEDNQKLIEGASMPPEVKKTSLNENMCYSFEITFFVSYFPKRTVCFNLELITFQDKFLN